MLNNPLYDLLLRLGLHDIDAQHIYVSAKHSCDVFLTCDGGVIARANSIQKLCGVTVQKPSFFVALERL